MTCPYRPFLGAAFAFLGVFCIVVYPNAAEGEEVVGVAYLTLKPTAVSANARVELDVELHSITGDAPSTMLLWFAYDSAALQVDEEYYEVLQRDTSGKVVFDDAGNAKVSRYGVRLGSAAAAKGVSLDYQVHEVTEEESVGALGISLSGREPLESGVLLSIAFRVLDPNADALTVDGIASDDPALCLTAQAGSCKKSSASTPSVQSVLVAVEDRAVTLPCEPPVAPSGLQASTNRNDGVLLTWQSLPGTVEYRVCAAPINDPGAAVPLGEGWLQTTSYLDEGAPLPREMRRLGCLRRYETVGRYYWVVSRDSTTHCESAPTGGGVLGARTAGKALNSSAPVAQTTAVPPAGSVDSADAGVAVLTIACLQILARQQRKRKGDVLPVGLRSKHFGEN
jgi:hypothetical protein